MASVTRPSVRRYSRAFIQLPEVWGAQNSGVNFRKGFRDYVEVLGDPKSDWVFVLEPNAVRVGALIDLWQGWPNAVVLNIDVGSLRDSSTDYFWSSSDECQEVFSPVITEVQQRFPMGQLRTRVIPVRTLDSIVGRSGVTFGTVTVSFDLRRRLGSHEQLLKWISANAYEALITWDANTPARNAFVDCVLRGSGLRRAGRAWGEAGTGQRYTRCTSAVATITASLAEFTVQIGRIVATTRSRWFMCGGWSRRWVKLRVHMRSGIDATDVVDDNFGLPSPPVPVLSIRDVLPLRSEGDYPGWSIKLAESDPLSVGHQCFDRHGVWPISFSYPGRPMPILGEPRWLVSPIVPGYPYAFEEPQAYMETYQDSFLAVTHRKAGWDCFRHLEILAAGAVPLMQDAGDIPGYSMVHYPKAALAAVPQLVQEFGSPPSMATRKAFRGHFMRHLTSVGMARYLLHASGLSQARSVLFVDARLPEHVDYLSVLTLIGLKQLLGQACISAFPVDYIYDDTRVPTAGLYGRGFGYSKVVPSVFRPAQEGNVKLNPRNFDVLVVGSISRNLEVAQEMASQLPADRTIWIHGEDSPPLPDYVHYLRSTKNHIVVRALHSSGPLALA